MTRRDQLRLLPLIIILLLSLTIASGLLTPKQTREQTSPIVGTRLPDFSVPVLEKPGSLFLPVQWQNKVAVVNLFASWCEPCKAEHPLLLQLGKVEGVSLYGIAWKDTQQNVLKYFTENGNPYLATGLDSIGKLTLVFGVSGLPETYVVDKKGIVRFKQAGPLSADIITQKILPLVQQLNAEK